MAFLSPPPSRSSTLLFFLLLLAVSAANAADSTTISQEFEDMLQSLRNYGYSLFTNAIATSDLKYQLLAAPPEGAAAASSNFTLFAPKDELLYALDMAIDAAVYVRTLQYHVIPNRRHTFADLKNLSAPFLDTLLPHYAVLIGKFRDVDVPSDKATIGLIVDGVRIEFPDIFVGSRIAVHGIDGILLTGLNNSRDLGGNDDGSDHIPPVRSPAPAPAVDANHAPISQLDPNDISPAPEFDYGGNIPVSLPPNYGNMPTQMPSVPTPASSSLNRNIPATRSGASPAESFFNGNIPRSVPTPSASSFKGNAPPKRSGVTPVTSSFNRNIPVKRSGFTSATSSFNRNIPAKRRGVTPAASSFQGNIPAKGSDSTRASVIDQNKVPSAAAASSVDRSNIPTAATSKIPQDQKTLGKKLPRKALRKADATPRISQGQKQLGKKPPRKGLRKGRHQHRRHRAVGRR